MEAFGGWLQFGRDGLRRGYFRVAGNLLSAHAGDGFVAERVFSLTAARVVRSRSGQIIVDMIDGRRLRLSGDTEAESKAWFRHLQQCSKRVRSPSLPVFARRGEEELPVDEKRSGSARGGEGGETVAAIPE